MEARSARDRSETGLDLLRLRGDDPRIAAPARGMMERQLDHLVKPASLEDLKAVLGAGRC